MSLVFPKEMSLATPDPKIDDTPKVASHNKPTEVPHPKPKATSTVTSETFVSPKHNETPPPAKSFKIPKISKMSEYKPKADPSIPLRFNQSNVPPKLSIPNIDISNPPPLV